MNGLSNKTEQADLEDLFGKYGKVRITRFQLPSISAFCYAAPTDNTHDVLFTGAIHPLGPSLGGRDQHPLFERRSLSISYSTISVSCSIGIQLSG